MTGRGAGPEPDLVREVPLREVLDALPRAVIATDAHGSIVVWNAVATSLYGWSEQEVLGRSVLDVLGPPDDRENTRQALQDALAGNPHSGDRTVLRRDGTPVRVLALTRPVLDEDGTVTYVVGVSEDITELRELQHQAQDLTDHLRLALDAGGLGTWRWDLATGRTDWDPRMEALFGLAPGGFDGTFEAWAALLHPDDRERVMGIVEDAVRTKGSYRLEHRVVTPDGAVRWIEGAGRVTLDSNGDVTGTIGCSHDVSDRVEAQLERERLTEAALASAERERVNRQRLELLASVNEALEGSEEIADIMRLVTRAVVPLLGDWCSLFVLPRPDEVIPLVETAHVDAHMVAYARELQERFPYHPDAAVGMPNVIRTGTPEFYPDITEDLIEQLDATPEQQEVVRQLGLRSAIAVPLKKRGRILGGMQFIMSSAQRRYTDEDLALAEAVASRIAASLDNRRLQALRRRTAEVDSRMAEVARRLSAARDLDSVMAIISAHGAKVVGSDYADVGLLHDAEHLDMCHQGTPRGTEPDPGYHRVPLSAHLPVTDAVRTGETILVEDLDRYEADPAFLLDPVREGVFHAAAASPLVDDAEQPVGVITFAWKQPHRFDDVDQSAIDTLARLCGQTVRRTQLSERAEDLADLAARLAAARTTRDVAHLLRIHGQERLGGARVGLRVFDPARHVLSAIVPAEPAPHGGRSPEEISIDAPSPMADAVLGGVPVWIARPDDYADRYPAEARRAQAVGLAATVSIPFVTSDGTVTGVITFAWPSAMRFDDMLRSALTTITDLAAQTFERAALTETHQRRDAILGLLSQALATASTRAGIGAAVAEHVPPLLDATFAVASFVDRPGAALESPTLEGLPAPLAALLGHLPLSSATPVAEVFRGGTARVFPDLHSIEPDHPGTARALRAAGIVALAGLPLHSADGVTRGVLTIGWSDAAAVPSTSGGPATTAADLVGQTLERTDLYEAEHAVITSLQRRLLAPLPRVDGLDLAAYYEPAAGAVGMGGDWYEAFELDDGSLVAVIGDVVGHGVEAIAAMAQLQHLVEGLLRTGTPLAQVLSRANTMVTGPERTFATAQLLHVDHAHQRVGYVNAAHPWALLRRPDGTVEQLSNTHHSMLGAPMTPKALDYVQMPVGSLLLGYTDGLVERRNEVITDSIDRLAACLAETDAHGPVEKTLDAIVETVRWSSDNHAATNDDIAAVLIRTTGPS